MLRFAGKGHQTPIIALFVKVAVEAAVFYFRPTKWPSKLSREVACTPPTVQAAPILVKEYIF